MQEDFRLEDHGPRKLRIATLCGLVFGTCLGDDAADLKTIIGAEIVGRIRPRAAQAGGGSSAGSPRTLPNNWKLYVENVRDTYHASLLHLFFTTFRINRLSQGGGVIVSPNGGQPCQLNASARRPSTTTSYAGMRSDDRGLPPGRPEPARTARRVRRRHPAADPDGVSRLRPAADPELPSRCGRCCRRAWTGWT